MADSLPFGDATDPSDYRRRLAATLTKEGVDTSPIGHWTQGLARMANAFVGSQMMNSENAGRSDAMKQLADVLLRQRSADPQTAAAPPDQAGTAPIAPVNRAGLPPMSPTMPGRPVQSPMSNIISAVTEDGTDIAPQINSATAIPNNRVASGFAALPPPAGVPASPASSMARAPTSPPAPSQPSSAAPGVDRDRMIALLQNEYLPPQMKNLLIQQLLPRDVQHVQTPDGTIVAIDPRTGTARPIYKGTPKPMVLGEGASLVSEDGKPLFQSPAKPMSVAEGSTLVTEGGRPLYQSPAKPMSVGATDRLVTQQGNVLLPGGPDKPPAGYEWADPANTSKGLTPIANGPATHLSSDTAGKLALMETVAADLPAAKEVLLKNRGGMGQTFVGRGMSVAGVGDIGRAQRTVSTAIEAALRTMSGAAVPDAEVARYKDLYMPTPNDSPETARQKLEGLDRFIAHARGTMTQGRVPNQPAAGGAADPLGIR